MNSKLEPLVQEQIKHAIKDLTALNPYISLRQLQQALDNKRLHCGTDYIVKIRKKVFGEAVAALDHTNMKKALAEVTESYRIKKQLLQRIMYHSAESAELGIPAPTWKDKIAAMKLDSQMELALFNTMVSLGIFAAKPEDIEEMRRTKPLPQEEIDRILNVMKKWDMIPHKNFKPDVYYDTDSIAIDEEVKPQKQEASKEISIPNHIPATGTVVPSTGATVKLSPFAPSAIQ